MNEAAIAYERAVRAAHRKQIVVRALMTWEMWIVVASVAYIVTRFAPWALDGFQVVAR